MKDNCESQSTPYNFAPNSEVLTRVLGSQAAKPAFLVWRLIDDPKGGSPAKKQPCDPADG